MASETQVLEGDTRYWQAKARELQKYAIFLEARVDELSIKVDELTGGPKKRSIQKKRARERYKKKYSAKLKKSPYGRRIFKKKPVRRAAHNFDPNLTHI